MKTDYVKIKPGIEIKPVKKEVPYCGKCCFLKAPEGPDIAGCLKHVKPIFILYREKVLTVDKPSCREFKSLPEPTPKNESSE